MYRASRGQGDEQVYLEPQNYPDDFKSILGIHSAINNNNDPKNWQRDLFELDYHLSIGTFTIIPIIRKIINLFR